MGRTTISGIVLAAGQGKRLRPLTDSIPKTLLAVDGERTLLDTVLANLAEAGVADVGIRMLAARGPGVVIALDDQKTLGEEEMKVTLDPRGWLTRINKSLDPAGAHGEYIGVTLV